jgi:hypothetical protein
MRGRFVAILGLLGLAALYLLPWVNGQAVEAPALAVDLLSVIVGFVAGLVAAAGIGFLSWRET